MRLNDFDIIFDIDLDPWHDLEIFQRELWLKNILQTCYRSSYTMTQRLVFRLNRGDIYDDHASSVGTFISQFQRILNEIDISNYFVVLITPDITLKNAYSNHFDQISKDPVPITILLEGDIIDKRKVKQKTNRHYDYNNRIPIKIDIDTLSDNKRWLLTESSTFCMYPWIHLHAYPTGEAHPCCHAEMKYPIGNTRQDSLQSIWNQEPMRQIRRAMLADREVSACMRCYEQEASGFVSGRVSANKHHGHLIDRIDHTDESGRLDEFKLTYWDIRFSNLCNLRCRSCGHIFSSSWYQDQSRLAGSEWTKNNKVLNFAGRTEIDMWEQLIPHFDYVEQIYFAGGEPLMMDEHYRILEELERRGRFDVRLIYNTNFTQTRLKDRSVFDYWRKFQNVAVGASLDAMGPRAEYIRKGTDWAQIESNREQMLQACPHVDFYVSATLSIMNAWHLPDFHRTWVDQGLIRAQDFNINILQDPAYYRIDIAPVRYKQRLRMKFAEHLEWLRPIDTLQRATRGYESAITFMMTTDNSFLINQFQQRTQQLDDLRNEQLLHTLPELEILYDDSSPL